MSNLNSAFEHYHLTHNNFIEAYRMVNEYVTELYRLPKHFLDETEGTMNSISNKHFSPKAPSSNDKSMRVVVDFMNQLEEFTAHTIQLFNRHMDHIEATEVYMNKVKVLDSQSAGQKIDSFFPQYTKLTPEVDQLMEGLKQIKFRADETLSWLEKLEVKWEDVQVKIRNAA